MQSSNLKLLPRDGTIETPMPPPPRREHAQPHTVQFYESEAFLAGSVAEYLAAGFVAGEPAIVIATDSHQAEFSERLREKGFDVDFLRKSGRLTVLSARETLKEFMGASMPDGRRFASALGATIDAVLRRSPTGRVRAYGEMVDLLWRDGMTAAAIRLEELWNDLAHTREFSLLCAYSMGNFLKASDVEQFRAICHQHSEVIPTEQYIELDTTDRMMAVSELQQRAQALEAEIAHRRQLEEQLRLALSEAEKASRAKTDFLAVMSHELRTPLNAIGGHVQLVEMGIHGPVTLAQREALTRVTNSQRHLLSLINDVLNFSRLESGRVEYQLQDLQISSLLADVTSMLDPLLLANKLACDVRSGTTSGQPMLSVRADREKMQQILFNLLTNAIKFTPAGGGLSIEARRSAHAQNMVEVCVRDTGVGIEPGKLETIFEPFVQLRKRPFAPQDGVGLGLAISRDLARGMGGELTATSVLGEGTTFTLSIPAAGT